MTQTPDLTPVASASPNEYGGITVGITFPNAGVDRPHSYGLAVTKKNAPRLIRAINAGAVTPDAKIATDVNGKTYVSFTSAVHTRYINVDLQRLGY